MKRVSAFSALPSVARWSLCTKPAFTFYSFLLPWSMWSTMKRVSGLCTVTSARWLLYIYWTCIYLFPFLSILSWSMWSTMKEVSNLYTVASVFLNLHALIDYSHSLYPTLIGAIYNEVSKCSSYSCFCFMLIAVYWTCIHIPLSSILLWSMWSTMKSVSALSAFAIVSRWPRSILSLNSHFCFPPSYLDCCDLQWSG